MPTVIATYTADPITIDGRLDEPAWQTAPAYDMSSVAEYDPQGVGPIEGGKVKVLWTDTHLILGVDFVDSDLIAECDRDHAHHYKTGDLAELFLLPPDNSWYWELYVTPRGNKTNFWFAGPGRVWLPSCVQADSKLQVAAHCRGTLNDWRNRDEGWTGELAIPIAELTAHGDRFEPGVDWRILVGRYNYTRYRGDVGPELSSHPRIPLANFHDHASYATLRLDR